MLARLPGEPLVWQDGPLLPLDQTPKMPEAVQASVTSSMNGSLDGAVVPHELLMMLGRLLASGFCPLRSVGSSIHCPEEISAASDGQHPFAAIHLTSGATPIWLAPSAPAMVPMVCVPWPSVSHGAVAHSPAASNQL